MTVTRLLASSLLALVALTAATCGGAGARGQSRSNTATPPIPRIDALELRRVWAGAMPNFYPSSPSPDGRLMSEIDWSTGDLAVIDMETAKLRRITNKGPWSASGDYAEFSVFSPDGQRMAYSWFSSEARGYQVRTVRLDGSDMRVVFPRNPEVAYVAVEDWSRDGASILVTLFRRDRTTQIGIVSAADGTYRSLKTNDWRPPSVLTFSPDGRFIAYDMARSTQRSESDIFVLAADGTRETVVVGGQDDNRLLGWLPDGRGILYHRRGSDARAVMALAVQNGQSAGLPQLVRPDVVQLVPLGFSRDAYFYGVEIERSHVHRIGVDLAAGRVVTEPVSLGDSVEGASHDAAWSPDSQTVAYLLGAPGGARMVIRSVSGELQRQIPVPLLEARKTQWAPDGSAVLVYGTDVEGRVGIHRVDLRTGNVTPVLSGGPGGETEGMAFWDISPDGQTIYHRRPKAPSQSHLMFPGTQKPTQASHVIAAHDLRTGTVKELLDVPSGRTLTVSPDGKLLAYSAHDLSVLETSVFVVPTSGGTPRLVYRQRGGNAAGNRGGIEWAPDGKSFLFQYAPKQGPGGIWQIPVDGSEPRLVLDDRLLAQLSQGSNREPWNFRLSPDGRQLVFEAGRPRAEIWMMSGFDAAAGQK